MANRNFVFAVALCVSVFGCAEQGERGEGEDESTDQVQSELFLGGYHRDEFSATWKGVFAPPKVLSDNPPTWGLLAQGEGRSDSIRNFFITIPHTTNLADGHTVGQYYITPRNNDRGRDVIMVELDEICTFTSPTTGICEGTGTITGGTGRYVTASGSIAIHVDVDFSKSAIEGRFKGKLSR